VARENQIGISRGVIFPVILVLKTTEHRAPLNHGKTGPDISMADFFYCISAARRGWSNDAIAARLMELSTKAKENGDAYARRTAEASRTPARRAR